MKIEAKLYVQLTNRSWMVSHQKIEVADEAEAIATAREHRAIAFKTYTVEHIVADGKTFSAEPGTFSERRYIDVARIYTRDEAIRFYEAELRQKEASSLSSRFALSALAQTITLFKQLHQDSVYIEEPGSSGDFIGLKPGEKAFDPEGQQLWPIPEKAKTQPTPPHTPLHSSSV